MEFSLVADIQSRCLLHGCHILAIAVHIMFEEQQSTICTHARTGSIQTCRAERHGASAAVRRLFPQQPDNHSCVLLEKSKCESYEVMVLTLSQMR
jgi:hypothetical protein